MPPGIVDAVTRAAQLQRLLGVTVAAVSGSAAVRATAATASANGRGATHGIVTATPRRVVHVQRLTYGSRRLERRSGSRDARRRHRRVHHLDASAVNLFRIAK